MSNVVALREREDPHPCPLPKGEGDAAQGELLPDIPVDVQRLLDANLDDVQRSRWPDGLVKLVEVQEATFLRNGLSPETAFRLARAAVLEMARYYGGRQWYLPRGDDLLTALRDMDIYRRANRDTIDLLAREHGLTTRSVLRIVSRQHRLHLRKVQGQLFADGGTTNGNNQDSRG